MHNNQARSATLAEDWEGRWFTIIARVVPNRLRFEGVVALQGHDKLQDIYTGLILLRDGALIPYIPLPTKAA